MVIGVAPADGQDADTVPVRFEKAGTTLDLRHASFKGLDQFEAELAHAHRFARRRGSVGH